MNTLKVLTYNIHKGFTQFNTKYILNEIKNAVMGIEVDIIFLQEVMGSDPKNPNFGTAAQFEHLADTIWQHYQYGQNSVTDLGNGKNKHHGNAILSKFPILDWSNHNISVNRFEKRGLLHSKIQTDFGPTVHLFNVHLNLFEKARHSQIESVISHINNCTQSEDRILLAGDFNDWRQTLTPKIASSLNMKETHYEKNGKHAVSFPSSLPILKLDRIYYRGFELIHSSVLNTDPWNKLSDHLPLLSEFRI